MTYREVAELVDSSFVVDVIFLDFSKAFDVANHFIMLTNLQMLGIGGKLLSQICEFLSGQTISVKVAGEMSSLKQVTSRRGIPQGLVLCYSLFLTFINFIANS